MDTAFTALPAYAELFCFSKFTFLHGASHAEELAERAAQLPRNDGIAQREGCRRQEARGHPLANVAARSRRGSPGSS